jgi:ferredoxin-NADP reductase
MSQIRDYTVVSSNVTNDSTLTVLLHDDTQRRPLVFKPGQYAAISFLHNKRPTPARCFSVTSSPTDQGYLQFGIRIHGHFTKTAAQNLIPGSKVIVEGPYGNFVFSAERDRSALFLAGGIGVSPFMSMLRYIARLQL